MYLEKEKIKNIDNYDIVNDFLFVENSKVKNHQNSTILDLKKIDYWGVSFYEKVFNVFTNRSHNSFYNYKGELLKEISKFNFYKFEDLNNYVGYDRELKKTVFIVNGIKENELEIKLGINCFYKNYIFLTIGNEVSIINCFKNKQL
ncbi:hypothetical protein, partial [Aurantibacter sp.]|uniref:hypothetical protein n=1 Tax=Aurantibacter sp. TaxID=2807103 RepID=UPI0032648B98